MDWSSLLGLDPKPPKNMTAEEACRYYSKPYNPDGIFGPIMKTLEVINKPGDVIYKKLQRLGLFK